MARRLVLGRLGPMRTFETVEATHNASLQEFWTALDHEKVTDHFVRLDTTAHGSMISLPLSTPQLYIVRVMVAMSVPPRGATENCSLCELT
ncbi:unnamed protein product [Heligmosomoides polygyrus]|uniref:Tyrosine-protein phosphatase domain-containing protein n=1 Tax=Heligmosomoides polygyrus TaxID=6339 RepID=A0A183FTP0_HELPZ|nr:unnamed protein product [Heligmosomoides polygyrus]